MIATNRIIKMLNAVAKNKSDEATVLVSTTPGLPSITAGDIREAAKELVATKAALNKSKKKTSKLRK